MINGRPPDQRSLVMVDEEFVMVESIDLPGAAVSKEFLEAIDKHIEDLSDDLRHISISIHDSPELQYKEYHAHRVLTEYLTKQDWKVTPSAYGIKTAFVAVYESGRNGPVVSFNAEYGRHGHENIYRLRLLFNLGQMLSQELGMPAGTISSP
jgi:hypothetical protein